MKKLLIYALLLCLWLAGCTAPTAPASESGGAELSTTQPAIAGTLSPSAPPSSTAEVSTKASESIVETSTLSTTATQEDPAALQEANESLEVIRQWLTEPCSFCVSTHYHYFPFYGVDQELRQVHGQDGSFNFRITVRQWNNSTNSDNTTHDYFHYRYEGNDYVCYYQNEQARMLVSADDLKSMERDKLRIVGPDALLPRELSNLREEAMDLETGYRVFLWEAPLSTLLHTGSYFSIFVYNAASWSDASLDGKDPILGFTLLVEPETLQPRELTVDFTEVKPLLFSDGALSGEFAMDIDLLSAGIRFNYDLAASVEPEFSLETWDLHPETDAP